MKDEAKVFSFYQSNKFFLNLSPAITSMVFIGNDEDGEYRVF